MKPGAIDTRVVQKMKKLHPREIPDHLTHGKSVKTGNEFDPNVYFTVLTNLAMKPGYVLDYVYQVDSLGACPWLYARAAAEKPLASTIEYEDWQKKNDVLSYLVADGSPDSFFQLAVFQKLAGQFYLVWHANYNDIKIVTTPKQIEAIISGVDRNDFGMGFTDEEAESMIAIDPSPAVEISDDRASVTYCIFTKWGGFARLKEAYLLKPPHLCVEEDIVAEVQYDCGIHY
jgi:hypothetical protein